MTKAPIALSCLALAALAAMPAFAQQPAPGVVQEAPALSDAQAKALFAQRYADFHAAMDKDDPDAIQAILTPDFSSTDMRGNSHNVDDMLSMAARLAMMSDPADRTTKTTIDSVTISGGGADVVQSNESTMQHQGRDGAMHTIEINSTSNDHWVRTDSTWRLQKTVTQSATFKRDGVEMHPGERRGRGRGGPPPGE